MFCQHCGNNLKEVYGEFCPNCGQKIVENENADYLPQSSTADTVQMPRTSDYISIEEDSDDSTFVKIRQVLLTAVITLIVLFGLTGLLVSRESSIQAGLTLRNYNRLEIGMSHSEVMGIVGRHHATRTSEVFAGQLHTVMYTVEGSGSRGANAVLTFQGSPLRLTAKAQMGLR